MKKKTICILLTLCMVFALMPAAAYADPPPGAILYVGNTDVSEAGESPTYWKAEGDGFVAGSAGEYDFSVTYDFGENCFTLTLNGVDITSYSTLAGYSDESCGIYTNGNLNMILASGTETLSP